MYNERIKDSENRIRYVELAIAQLQTSPTPETSALREWAVELLDSQAPVKLSAEAKAQLKTRPLVVQLSARAEAASVARGELTVVPASNANLNGSGPR